MFKLFRKIRWHNLHLPPLPKYFVYVIGEITLIVVGILIALQVNNWNENNKRARTEQKILQEISVDLKNTRQEINADLESHIKAQNYASRLKELLQDEAKDRRSIVRYFENALKDRQAYPKTSGYESLRSKGLEILSNDSLRIAITNLYQLEFVRLLDFGATQDRYSITALLTPYLKKHFYLTDDLDKTEKSAPGGDPVSYYEYGLRSYHQLRADTALLIDLQRSFDLRRKKINRHLSAIAGIDRVLEMIE